MASTPRDFKVTSKKGRNARTIEFTLGNDHVYKFSTPKKAGMLLGIADSNDEPTKQMKVMLDWLDAGLGEKQSAHLRDRLLDPADDLDWDDLEPVMNWLVEQTTENPTS